MNDGQPSNNQPTNQKSTYQPSNGINNSSNDKPNSKQQ
jgi:hypothetical protein